MADLADVSDTFAALVAAALYPNGTGQPSVTGTEYRIFPGWPDPQCLTSAIKSGNAQISVHPLEVEKNTTRYLERDLELRRNEKTLTATVEGSTVTLGGTVTTPQNVSLFVGGTTVAYGLQNGQTVAQVASALATLLSTKGIAASSTGPVITIPGVTDIAANVGVAGEIARVLRRQNRHFVISIWAPSHQIRTATAKVVDVALTRLNWIMLPDLTKGRNIHVRSNDLDDAQEASIYRRDLVFTVDFPTIEVIPGTEIVNAKVELRGNGFINPAAVETFVADTVIRSNSGDGSGVDEWSGVEW